MKEVMNERNFGVLEGTERTDWEVFRLVVDNFLIRHKEPNYRQTRKWLEFTEWWDAICH
jgi:hypothetical protein